MLAILIIIQFFRIDKTNPAIVVENDFITISNPPQEIATILKTTCYDCHSNETNYPWYANIAPISWWLKDHINEGRDELNFSNWGKFKLKRKDHKLEEAIELVEEGEMPIDEYTWTHSDAKLTQEKRAQLIEWFKEKRLELKTKKDKNKKELYLNKGGKWASNPETTAGINRMIAIINDEIKDVSLSAFNIKGQKLNVEMKTIFAECTMKGEAHEQLHLFLLPLVKKFRELEEVES